jgi:ADP-ribose pyrophosphatase
MSDAHDSGDAPDPGAEPRAGDSPDPRAEPRAGGAPDPRAEPRAGGAPEARDDVPGRLASRPVHRGRIVDLAIDTVRFPDGSVGEIEMIRHSGAAAVLPVLAPATHTSADAAAEPRVLLIRQYRYASGGYMLEVPAGRPDEPGEDWELCARRELEEETGLVAGALTFMTSIFTTPGFTDEQIRLYLATDCTGTGTGKLDHDEFIEPVELSLAEALERVRAGEITDGKTICCLLFAARFLL